MLIRVGIPEKKKNAMIERACEQTIIRRNFVGSSGLRHTGRIGPRAGEMIDILTDPKVYEQLYGREALLDAHARRQELDDVGARGRYTGALGMSRKGDMQYLGKMKLKHFLALQITDPESVCEEEIEKTLDKLGLGVKNPFAIR